MMKKIHPCQATKKKSTLTKLPCSSPGNLMVRPLMYRCLRKSRPGKLVLINMVLCNKTF